MLTISCSMGSMAVAAVVTSRNKARSERRYRMARSERRVPTQ